MLADTVASRASLCCHATFRHHRDVARDTDRQKTYDAETAAFGHTVFETPVGLYALRKLTTAVCRTTWWRERHPRVGDPTLRQTRPDATRSTASASRWEIRFCHQGDTVATLTHELAHLCSPDDGHGAAFRRDHVDLVALTCGPDAAERLQAAYRSAGLGLASPDRRYTGTTALGERGLLAACGDVIAAPSGAALRHAERVSKLLAKASATTEAEADALRAKAFELSVKHGVSTALLEAAAGGARIVERQVALGAGPYVAARTDLLSAVARHRSCEMFWVPSRTGRLVTVVGFTSDAADVLLMFSELDHAALLGATRAKFAGNTQQARRQYLFGFAAGVEEQFRAAQQSAGVNDTGSSAALVLVERRKAVRDHVRENHKVTTERGPAVRRSDAFRTGQIDGRSTSAVRRKSFATVRGALAPVSGR
jgi:hypothetical protein